MVVIFTKDASTLTFPSLQNRQYPLNDALGQKGALHRTAVGVPAADVRKVASPLTIPLALVLVGQDFYDDLEDWFTNTCKGKLYKFYYTNSVTGESTLPVRWMNGFNFKWADGFYSGEIVLEKEI